MATYGITSVSDAATGTGPAIEPALAMYERAAAVGPLAGRVQLMPQIHYVAPPDGDSSVSPDHFPLSADSLWLTIGPVKIFSDGALSTRTAALREPYAGDGANQGILLWPDEILASMIGRAHAAGWQIATHALGDRAVATVVDAYQRALEAHPRADHRHRIEHCMLLDDSLAVRIRDLGIVPSLQPDIFRLGDGYVSALGRDRASTSIPIGTFRRLGVRIALSSDAPVIPCDPLPIIRSAVERRTPSGVHLGSDEASTVAEAIDCYTVGGAFATRTDGLKGRLRPGMLADFTVLSRDPVTVPTEEFDSLQVTMTVVGGRQSYSV
jgi:predicted amidohydrolase YtcJ